MSVLNHNDVLVENDSIQYPVSLRDDEPLYLVSEYIPVQKEDTHAAARKTAAIATSGVTRKRKSRRFTDRPTEDIAACYRFAAVADIG